MDMISWDAIAGPTLRLHTRTRSNPGYNADMAIAVTFSDVVATYGLSSGLTPIITSDGESASDHSSFWHSGYPAILAIEDDYDDFTPDYHTTDDIRQRLNMTYFTNFTKASVGTVAHLALPSTDCEAVTLADAISAIQIMAGITSARTISTCTGVNNDGRISLADAIYILQNTAGLR